MDQEKNHKWKIICLALLSIAAYNSAWVNPSRDQQRADKKS